MAYDYKPGEDEGILRRYALIVGVVLVLATLIVLTLYLGLGIDRETLKVLVKRFAPDAVNVIFVFIFVLAALALWGLFREPAAAEDVERRHVYFVLLLILAGLLLVGTVYLKRFARPTHEVMRTEVCPRCGGLGRAKLRPEYPCPTCNGTGHITP